MNRRGFLAASLGVAGAVVAGVGLAAPREFVYCGTAHGRWIGPPLYPRTASELSAGVTPSNYAYPELDVRRYAPGDVVLASGVDGRRRAYRCVSAWTSE